MGGLKYLLFSVLAAVPAIHAMPAVPAPAQNHTAPHPSPPRLSFTPEGKFKIVQFSDTQDSHLTDRRTLQLMNMVLDAEKPQFVVINGDLINGDPTTAMQVRQAINNVVLPMERRGIPWAITWGNHDEDSLEEHGTGMTERKMMDEVIRKYRYNINWDSDESQDPLLNRAHDQSSSSSSSSSSLKTRAAPAPLDPRPNGGRGITGQSNVLLEIGSSRADKRARGEPGFVLYLLDSGRYAVPQPGGQDPGDDLKKYDWIRPDQLAWYRRHSEDYEARFHPGSGSSPEGTEERLRSTARVEGMMFFHIPLWEHHNMWYGQQFTSSELPGKLAAAKKRHSVSGAKNEDVYVGLVNSGMYSALRERGDVVAVYSGHDHINNYKGNYFGVEIGYGASTGFGAYGLRDGTWDMHTLRGARIFELDENEDAVRKNGGIYAGRTRITFAKNLGIDMNPKKQPIDKPDEIPDYVI